MKLSAVNEIETPTRWDKQAHTAITLYQWITEHAKLDTTIVIGIQIKFVIQFEMWCRLLMMYKADPQSGLEKIMYLAIVVRTQGYRKTYLTDV